MTDSASRDPDQLASDLADGLLPPDEAARLRADPEVAARVARIEAIRTALRSSLPPAPPAGAVDRMVAAAVDAATTGSGPRHLHTVPPPSPGSRVGAPHTVPSTPSAARGRATRSWLAAAAAVAVGLAMAGVLARSGGSDSDDMATAGDAAQDAPTEAEEHSDEGGETTDDAGAGAAASDDGDLPIDPDSPSADTTDAPPEEGVTVDGPLSTSAGSADSPEELADLVRAQRAGSSESPPVVPGQTEADTCPGLRAEGDVSRGVATYSAEAEYQGTLVTVHVYESESGMRLVATDPSCTDVVDVPFEE